MGSPEQVGHLWLRIFNQIYGIQAQQVHIIMQVFPPLPLHYLSLAPCVPLIIAGFAPSHIALVAFFCLLLKAGTCFENYCNMAGCLLLGTLILLQNMGIYSRLLASSTSCSLWETLQNVLMDWRVAVCSGEAIGVVIGMCVAARKYRDYRQELLMLEK